MDMQHGRIAPAVVATAIGAALFGAYIAFIGLDADIGHSAALLAMAIATFVVPGCAGAICMRWREGRDAPLADPRELRPADAAVPLNVAFTRAVSPPFPAAEAVADIRSLTEARVERSASERRTGMRGARRPVAAS